MSKMITMSIKLFKMNQYEYFRLSFSNSKICSNETLTATENVLP